MNLNSNKNSPLEYLERLVLLPEAQTADAKGEPTSELNSFGANSGDVHQSNNSASFYEHASEIHTPSGPAAHQSNKNLNKRNLNDISPISNSKKHCNTMNTMNYGGGQSYNRMPPQQQQQQQIYSSPSKQQTPPQQQQQASLLANDPAFDDDAALIASLNVNLTNENNNANSMHTVANGADTASANIIDASNFDFLDYLPELNSTTIDQTITTANIDSASSTSLSSSSAQPAQLDLHSPESIDNLFAGSANSAGYKTVSYTHLTLPTKRIV